VFSLASQRLRRELNSRKARLRPRTQDRLTGFSLLTRSTPVRFAGRRPRLLRRSISQLSRRRPSTYASACASAAAESATRQRGWRLQPHAQAATSSVASPVSAQPEQTHLLASRIGFGALVSRVTSSLVALPPNPSLSTDPLRQASLPVRRLGLCCSARASRPASAVGVSSNVRPHREHHCAPPRYTLGDFVSSHSRTAISTDCTR
jgi:hypothetical protein